MRFSFCPVCGNRLSNQKHDGETVPMCQNPSCGFIFWQNSKPCVTVLIADAQGRLLMGVRAKEPDKGKLDLPGGFLQEGEHPHDGAQREIKEELGVSIEILDHLAFVMDRYGKDGDHTLNIGVIARITDGTPSPADDVVGLEWVHPDSVPANRLAFTNNETFLKYFLQYNKSLQEKTRRAKKRTA
ncbi:MAG: hypothetical protein A2677_03115 [Candidatus Komeilibacteria bacterium RIFCSPHIGHO2_01_FULL_52_14]|uniref:Nudix hydrolase domain-containing protein n=1 Tax=Candidatus Komeilibacteria bacterium RIFCSPHIGHO2_01_FULL_52_14 TaxID=1798549 RepID=A0A1G2BPF2_9BACT|nr:MAG: hypothetical protein A2677_03115 [Candidatus Komeilibacteria bacterium RIFCSPHIGHO2_01_FULL_52_14]